MNKGSVDQSSDDGIKGLQPLRDRRILHEELFAELSEAEAHLRNSARAARAQDSALAESIEAVGLEASDLMRWRLRGRRLAANLTQAEVARRIGARPRAVADFEAGKRMLHPELIQKMSEAIGGLVEVPLVQESQSTVLRQVQTAVAGERTSPLEVVASGSSMEPSIRHGDKLMVSHTIELAPGRIVVAIHGDAWIVKRLALRDARLVLRSDNATEEVELSEVSVQGVVVELRRTL